MTTMACTHSQNRWNKNTEQSITIKETDPWDDLEQDGSAR